MSTELVKKKIDGHTYEFGCMNPKKSIKLLSDLLNLVGVPIGDAVGSGGLEKLGENPGKIIENICKAIDGDRIIDLTDRILDQAIHCRTPDDKAGYGEVSKSFNKLFTRKLAHMFKVIYAALEIEYADFLGEDSVLKNLGKLKG